MDITDHVDHLIRIDLDAVRAYTQAIENVPDQAVRDMLTSFRADHERHVEDLSNAIVALGGEPPRSAHLSGFALAGFTGVVSGMGVSGALMAMQSNEVVTNQAYELALRADLPGDLRPLIEGNLGDEQRHLDTIRRWLEQSSPVGAVMSGSATMQGLGTSVWMNVFRRSPMATAVAATGAAMLLGGYLLGHKRHGGQHHVGH
jgi:uncharacterized protein (TIGR02284 family)